ncbi:MAG: chromate transporter [Deltaproteobacteria bacterium]|nr:MAG: chromate transporter [Deltaproteobacteria bacterium]
MGAPDSSTLQTLLDLAVSWGRVGVVGFGGGPAMIPLMKAECIDLRGWLDDDQFLEAIALCYTLPGPISAKMSIHVGLQVAGWAGAAVAFAAVMAPSGMLMVALAGLYLRFREHPAVHGAMAAVKPVALGLLVWTVIGLAPEGAKSWQTVFIAIAAIAALYLKVHPALVIVAAMLGGAIFLR